MSAFDKIAKGGSELPKAASKSKAAATVNEEISNKVDLFVANKAELKRIEADMKDIESAIIEHVRPQQDEMAYCGSFTKSLTVAGKVSSVLYSTSDRFSVPQDDDAQAGIKKLVGKKFDDMFEVKRSIAMKESALKDESTLNKIAAACEKAGLNIGDLFDVADKIIAKDSLDEKQYLLKPAQLAEFRSLVRQSKPALK